MPKLADLKGMDLHNRYELAEIRWEVSMLLWWINSASKRNLTNTDEAS